MRLVTFEPTPHRTRIGAYGSGLRVIDLNLAYALYLRDVEKEANFYALADARVPADMRGLFEGGDKSLDAARAARRFCQRRAGLRAVNFSRWNRALFRPRKSRRQFADIRLASRQQRMVQAETRRLPCSSKIACCFPDTRALWGCADSSPA